MKNNIFLNFCALLAVVVFAANTANAQTKQGYAELSSDGKTLTFKYGVKPATNAYDLNTGTDTPAWGIDGIKYNVTTVKFDESFQYVKPTSCYYWFYDFVCLANIYGIEYLNTSEVENMSHMFDICNYLTELDLTNFNTENVTDMENMFSSCVRLRTLTLGNFSNAKVTNMRNMFGACWNLTELDLTNFKTDNVTDMNCMFTFCSKLTSLDLSSFNTGNVTDMTGMFSFCDALTTLDVSSFNTEKVTNMYAMFGACAGLTSLDVSNFNTERVTNMYEMFMSCSSLTVLDVSHFNTSGVTNMGQMFANCSSLTVLDLSHFNTSGVTDMGEMFSGCSSLKTIKVGGGWNTSNVDKSDEMFLNCTELVGGQNTAYNSSFVDKTYARMDGGPTSETPGYLTDARGPYVELSSDLKTLTFKYGIKPTTGTFYAVYDLAGGGWLNNDKGSITDVVFDETFKDARPLHCSYWFSNFVGLTTITGIENLNISQVNNMSFMFLNCWALTTLDLSHFNTVGVKDMESMFYGCGSLETIKVGSDWNTDAVENSNGMFYNCAKLVGGNGTTYSSEHTDKTYARMDGGPTSETPGYLTDGRVPYVELSSDHTTLTFKYGIKPTTGTFSAVYDLNTGTGLPGWYYDYGSVTTVVFDESFRDARPTSCYYWFYDYRTLSSIEHLEYLNTSKVENMNSMFYYCNSLTSLDLSTFNTASVKDMGSMFYDCINLTALNESTFNTESVTTMEKMFAYCSKLTALDVSNFNTAGVNNMNQMFNNCSKLTALGLTNFNTAGVEDMEQMFYLCTDLKTIKVGSGWNTDAVTNSSNMFTGSSELVGGNGTAYSSEHTDKTYARMDGGSTSETPGYLTDGRVPYVELSSDRTTFTFKYGIKPTTGTFYAVYDLNTGATMPDWVFNTHNDATVTTVVFDESFKDARPTSCYHWFVYYEKLSSIEHLEYLNTSEVKNMACMFYYCSKLTALDLTNFNTASVEDMRSMFFLCTGLKTIKVGSGWNTDAVTNSNDMFYNCAELVGGKGTTYSSEHTNKTYARMDGGSTSETPGYLTDGREPYVELSSDRTTLTFKYGIKPTTGAFSAVYDLGGGGWMATSHNKGTVTKVVFDESFKDARPGYCSYWFSDFTSITTITGMEYLNTSEAINLNFMFKNCFRLTSIDVSNFNTEKVENMPYMFSGCTGLTALDLTNFSTASVKDMESMFNGCTGLKTIKVGSGWNTDAVTKSSNMFTDCSVLVGGNGTTYSSEHIDKTYARMDWTNHPGYLTGILYDITLPENWKAYSADDTEQTTPITSAPADKKIVIKYTGDKKVKKVEVIKE